MYFEVVVGTAGSRNRQREDFVVGGGAAITAGRNDAEGLRGWLGKGEEVEGFWKRDGFVLLTNWLC